MLIKPLISPLPRSILSSSLERRTFAYYAGLALDWVQRTVLVVTVARKLKPLETNDLLLISSKGIKASFLM